MRRRIVCLCAVFILLLTGCTEQAEPLTVETTPVFTHKVYEITLCKTLLYNHSVGNDWKTVYMCDGTAITSGKQWTVPRDVTKRITINVTVTERDKWPDSGSCSLSVVLTDGFETSATVTVTENKGQFKGNEAQWIITCKISLVDKQIQKTARELSCRLLNEFFIVCGGLPRFACVCRSLR